MTNSPSRNEPAVWHAGELALQERVGVPERMDEIGRRVIRNYLPDQHRDFYAQLPFVVAGSVDSSGDSWATFLTGKPGFLTSPSPDCLHIDAVFDQADPASNGLSPGAAIGLLGIELQTRRRNRVNGTLERRDGGFQLTVDQSFGNCPQYIQLREPRFVRDASEPHLGMTYELPYLDAAARRSIEAADTFFVASYADREDGHRQVDVSHRGGKPGFVHVAEDGTLTIPDFSGNLFFATLGNILLNGKAGLIFTDFTTGEVLQLTGDAEIVLDSPLIAAFEGAERLWKFRARRIVRRPDALPLRWDFQDDAPDRGWSLNTLATGDWPQAAKAAAPATSGAAWRPFRVARIVDESSTIRSFILKPADGTAFPPHRAGQHLPIRITLPGEKTPSIRSYTLSVAPSDGFYRISVKRDGLVSSYLHDMIAVDDVIDAKEPAGAFQIDAQEARPAVLLAGGVGITPIMAMLRHVIVEGRKSGKVRPTFLFQASRTLAERAFDGEIAALADASGGAVKVIRVLSDETDAQIGDDYDAAGRIDMTLIGKVLPFGDYDFYICGPGPFMQSLYDGLRGYNVADSRIHAEAFGPSALVRRDDTAAGTKAQSQPAATRPVAVVFAGSGQEARWTPGSGTLLELAEARGLEPEFGCRNGSCGTCSTRLLQGEIAYPAPPASAVPDGEVLICCAVPAETPGTAENRIHLAL